VVSIPRKAPNDVTEHRVTLGNYERQQLKEVIDASQANAYLSNVPNIMLGVAGVGVAAGVGIAAYALWRYVGLGSITDKMRDTVSGFTEGVIFGVDDIFGGNAQEGLANIENMYAKQQQASKDKMIFRMEQLQAIIDNPASTENMKQQALIDQDIAKRKYQREQKALRKRYRQTADDLNPYN
jgi:hypothetical protein